MFFYSINWTIGSSWCSFCSDIFSILKHFQRSTIFKIYYNNICNSVKCIDYCICRYPKRNRRMKVTGKYFNPLKTCNTLLCVQRLYMESTEYIFLKLKSVQQILIKCCYNYQSSRGLYVLTKQMLCKHVSFL